MTQRQLEKLAAWWQDLLRLSHWDVVFQLASQRDLGRDINGDCASCLDHFTALVRVHNGARHDDGPWPYDPEEILVHELLHLFPALNYQDEAEPRRTQVEQCVNMITSALLALKRGQ